MKIAIVLTGISYGLGRDFSHCFPNINEKLILPLKKNHDVSILLYTYDNEKKEDLIRLYEPLNCVLIPIEGSEQIGTYIQSMKILRNYNFDFIISTRFDIHFKIDIDSIKFDVNKFNALFPELGFYNKLRWWPLLIKGTYIKYLQTPYFAKYTCDNFFAFPYKMLDDFIFVLEAEQRHPTRRGEKDLHSVYNRVEKLIGEDNVHLVSKIQEESKINSFYYLCRQK